MYFRSSTVVSAQDTPSDKAVQRPDIALSKDCAVVQWAAQPSPDSGHCIILLKFLIGDDESPAVVPRRDRTLLACEKANWNKRRGMTNQLCRIPRELTSMDSTERRISSGMQKATKATVPAGSRQPSPFWTPGLAELDRTIAAAPHAERSERLKLRRRGVLRGASKSCRRTLRTILEVTAGNIRQVLRRVYAPCSLSMPVVKSGGAVLSRRQKVSHLVKLWSAKATRHPKSSSPPPIPTNARGFTPITMAELKRIPRLLPLGPAPGAGGMHGEALRHLGRVVKRAVPGCPIDAYMQEPSRVIGDVEPSYSFSIRRKRHPTATPTDLSRWPAALAGSCKVFLPRASEASSSPS
ncbi:hypothetical protein TcYC6_0099470 [Trypanosoma cruzi]|nr:hypothetical protein TcYC6_0099470 [Trypanosoma cruzi]